MAAVETTAKSSGSKYHATAKKLWKQHLVGKAESEIKFLNLGSNRSVHVISLTDCYMFSGEIREHQTMKGVCSMLSQKALLSKLILNSLSNSDLIWREILWSFLRFTKFGFSICLELRSYWRWSPRYKALHLLKIWVFLLLLLWKGTFLSNERYEELMGDFKGSLAIPAFLLHENGTFDDLEELKEWSFTAGNWIFSRTEWFVICLISGMKIGFPFAVDEIPRLFREIDASLTLGILNQRWAMDLTSLQWILLCKKMWRSGIHRRDGLFLWRMLGISNSKSSRRDISKDESFSYLDVIQLPFQTSRDPEQLL
ncbi:hypothetical protein R1flu_025193 [Riccia fluitans]|uniref:Uncharacterized protein n=1 Tax=Riccia fluitans TaxID=41844 RepID=A0ABD1Y016_9MARC